MSEERIFGLQWRLAVVYLAAGLFSPAIVAVGYLAGTGFGLHPHYALGLGVALGITVGIVGAVAGFMVARSVKLRLWEAGRMASRIASGDLQVRLHTGASDEVGWLEEQLNEMAGHLQTAVGELQTLAEQNRRLGEEACMGAALEERARLARDLHDTVNQHLFALAMRAAAVLRRVEEIGEEAAVVIPELESLETLARQAHSQTRELILQLRPVTLEQQGLGAALEEYVNNIAAREGWVITREIDPSIRLDGSAGESFFRVAQEVLHNIAKHARARSVRVRLTRTDGGVMLSIKDDGVGFEPRAGSRPTAVGLRGVRERVASMRGKCDIKSAPERGTEVTVTAPVDSEGGDAR